MEWQDMKYADYQPTPIEAVDYMKPFIEGRVVYDLGAGDGTFAQAMSEHAKKVVAVEMDGELSNKCSSRGIETINENFMNVDLSDADVIFIFMGLVGNYTLTKKLARDKWKGTVLSHYYPLQEMPMFPFMPNELIDVRVGNIEFPILRYEIN